MDEKVFSRQLDILSPDEINKEIMIIGTGAIGSVTAFCLAKIGCKDLLLIDHDKVEIENVPSQLFKPEHVKTAKVLAIADTLIEYTETEPKVKEAKWDKETAPIMIIAVDSMKTRKEIYNKLKKNYMIELMIESRMSAERMRIYAGMPSDEDFQKFYEKTLYSDEEASPEKCTEKAIAYNTFVIGGIIASLVKKHFKDEKMPKELIFNLEDYSLYAGWPNI